MKKVIIAANCMLCILLFSCSKVATTPNHSNASEISVSTNRNGTDDNNTTPPSTVPDVVVNNFKKSFPNAKKTEYQTETQNGNLWVKIKFYLGQQRWIATYSSLGNLISLEKK